MSRQALLPTAWVVAAIMLASDPASAITTFKYWDGHSAFPSFGCGSPTPAATLGQVVTIPKGQTQIDKFYFSWHNVTNGSLVMRGEVYAWDGEKATGNALYESRPRKAWLYNVWRKVTFRTGGIPVTPGAQYVVFASIDKDFDRCEHYFLEWGFIGYVGDLYAGGGLVYQTSHFAREWTRSPWGSADGLDLAFKVTTTP